MGGAHPWNFILPIQVPSWSFSYHLPWEMPLSFLPTNCLLHSLQSWPAGSCASLTCYLNKHISDDHQAHCCTLEYDHFLNLPSAFHEDRSLFRHSLPLCPILFFRISAGACCGQPPCLPLPQYLSPFSLYRLENRSVHYLSVHTGSWKTRLSVKKIPSASLAHAP